MPNQMLIVASLCFLPLPIWSQARLPVRDVGSLEPHRPVERAIAPGETEIFSVHMRREQFVRVRLEHRGIHVVLSILDPSGREIVSVDNPGRDFGFEDASSISMSTGEYQVRTEAKSGAPGGGTYRIELVTLHKPGNKDHVRLRAEGLLRSAVADDRAGTTESRQHAIEEYTKANALWSRLRDEAERALGLFCIGMLHSTLGDEQKALKYYQRALAIRRAVGDRAGEADALYRIGYVYGLRDDTHRALAYLQQALAIRRAVGDRAGEADAQFLIGSVYIIDDNQKALKYYKQALVIRTAIGDRSGEVDALNNIGVIYWTRGEMQKALEYYQHALAIRKGAGDSSEARALNNIGNIYFDLGQKEKALEYYQEALPITKAAGDRFVEVVALNNIGRVHHYLGQIQTALQYFQQALPICRPVADHEREADTLNDIGRSYHSLGQMHNALESHQQALRLADDPTREADSLNGMGSVYSALGEKQKARDCYQRALSIWRSLGFRLAEADTFGNLRDLFRQSQPDLGILFGKQAVNVLQSIRRANQGLEQGLQRSYEGSVESVYRSLADLLIERSRFGEAEDVLNLLKDKEAADVIRRDSVSNELRPATLLDFEKKALARYEEIEAEIVALGQKKSTLLGKRNRMAMTVAELKQSNEIDRDLNAANTVLRRFFDEQEKLFAADSKFASRVTEFKEAEGLQDVLQKLGPDVVAIYTLVTPEKYVAMLVTSGARKAYTTRIQESELNRKIFQFRMKLQDPTSDPLPLARELYGIVFPEGLRQDLDAVHAKTIMWSIDNTLRYIPIAALHDGKDYLLKAFRNSLITPASLSRLTEEPARQWQGAGFGVSETSPPLSAVPLEMKLIFRDSASGLGSIPGTVRLNADFTRVNFENDLKRKRNDVVHIATHFHSRPGVAANSELILGDGKLSLNEIEAKTRLFDGVELLTLSACNTAFTNRNEDGREVDSFGTIAQRLGAKGVIASLWSVNDPATARLMGTLYRLRVEEGISKIEALRRGQEAMLKGTLSLVGAVRSSTTSRPATTPTGWSHPFYWAPFILIGNWK